MQRLNHGTIAAILFGQDVQARKVGTGLIGKATLSIDGRQNRQAIFLPHHKIFLTMARRGMDNARARLGGNVLAENTQALAIEEGVLGGAMLQQRPRKHRFHG